jgi:hypothetical protein
LAKPGLRAIKAHHLYFHHLFAYGLPVHKILAYKVVKHVYYAKDNRKYYQGCSSCTDTYAYAGDDKEDI